MSSSSERYDSDSSSSSIPNISKTTTILSGTIPSSKVSSDSDKGNSDSEEKEIIGNTDWCVCGGKCRPMETLPKVYVVVKRMKFQKCFLKASFFYVFRFVYFCDFPNYSYSRFLVIKTRIIFLIKITT